MAYLSRIAPEIPVSDLNKATEYYEQKLGFRVVANPAAGYAIVERDDVAIHLFADNGERLSPVSIHIFTEGLDELQEEFLRRGANVTQTIAVKPWANRDFRVKDENGNEIKFTEPISGVDEA